VRTHLDVVLPYFRRYADRQQQERWFPGISAGELMTSIALSEPDTAAPAK
jgi:acyl-CoA dehydrogenase